MTLRRPYCLKFGAIFPAATIWAVAQPRGVPALVPVPSLPHQPLADPPWCLVQLWCAHQVSAHAVTPGALWRALRCAVVHCGDHSVVCTPLVRALWPGNWSGVLGCGMPLVALDPTTVLERTIVYIVRINYGVLEFYMHCILGWEKTPGTLIGLHESMQNSGKKYSLGAIEVLHRVRPHVGFGRARMIAGP